MQQKVCGNCGESKPISDFYRHSQMADGYLGKCKTCVKKRVRLYREAHIDQCREYDRKRQDQPHRIAAHRSRKPAPSAKRVTMAKYHDNHPLAKQAHTIVGNAIRDGKLNVKPCERCGYGVGVHAHHEDYSKPLEVNWLCRPCHGRRHREINAARRKSARRKSA